MAAGNPVTLSKISFAERFKREVQELTGRMVFVA